MPYGLSPRPCVTSQWIPAVARLTPVCSYMMIYNFVLTNQHVNLRCLLLQGLSMFICPCRKRIATYLDTSTLLKSRFAKLRLKRVDIAICCSSVCRIISRNHCSISVRGSVFAASSIRDLWCAYVRAYPRTVAGDALGHDGVTRLNDIVKRMFWNAFSTSQVLVWLLGRGVLRRSSSYRHRLSRSSGLPRIMHKARTKKNTINKIHTWIV